MFNCESGTFSIRTMWRELKGLGLNIYENFRKQIISKTDWKKGSILLQSIQIELWNIGRKSCGLSSPELVTLFQSDGCIRVLREAHKLKDPSCSLSPVQASGGSAMNYSCCSWLGQGLAAICAQRNRSAIWLIKSFNGFFSSLMEGKKASIQNAQIVK